MPYEVTHILFAIILIELFREHFIKNSKKIPKHYIFIAALGAIIPDLDIAAYYVLYFFDFTLEQVHRTFLHTIFVPIIIIVLGAILFDKKTKVALILSLATISHLFLDLLFGGIMPLYPILNYRLGINLFAFIPNELCWLAFPTLDGIFLLAWIFWIEFRKKTFNQ